MRLVPLVAFAGQTRETPLRRTREKFKRKPGFTDSGPSRYQYDRSISPERAAPGVPQLLQLCFPPNNLSSTPPEKGDCLRRFERITSPDMRGILLNRNRRRLNFGLLLGRWSKFPGNVNRRIGRVGTKSPGADRARKNSAELALVLGDLFQRRLDRVSYALARALRCRRRPPVSTS